jgi:hypothetical protein
MTKPWLAALVCGLALTLAACTARGTSAGSSTAPPSSGGAVSEAALCADVDALRASVDKLRNVTVQAGAADEIKADAGQVKANLSAFVTDAHGRWEVQVAQIQAALAALEAAVNGLAASPGTATLAATRAAISTLGAATRNLVSAVHPTCSSGTPSAGSS